MRPIILTIETARRARDLRRREGLSWSVLAERFGASAKTLKAAIHRLEAVEAARDVKAPTEATAA